jgi:sugar (pentulose or hexulose) kinase
MRLHARSIGVAQVKRVIATGGGSSNIHMLQVLADIFGAPIYTSDSGPNAAALGAALRAVHAWYCNEVKQFVPFNEVIRSNSTLRANPIPEFASMYSTLVHRYQALEKRVVEVSGERVARQ